MTSIEWTQRPGTKGVTWNPIRARNKKSGKTGHYCVKLSPGCANCYAERLQPAYFSNDARYAAQDRDKVEIFLDEETLRAPLSWKKPRTIFVCSMSDVFADFVEDAWLDKIFAVMALCPQHTFQVLTKRAERMRDYVTEAEYGIGYDKIWRAQFDVKPAPGHQAYGWPLPNVWLGVSCERQQEADERIPLLLQTPAAVRFISAEPLLGPIDLSKWIPAPWIEKLARPLAPSIEIQPRAPVLDWVIAGGESGPHARPMQPDWARSLRDQCKHAGVRFFFKQWGEFAPLEDVFSDAKRDQHVYRVGKKAAGRLLDGRLHNDFPKGAAA